MPARASDRLFHYRTRYYLQRRAWRYFRRMGFQKPERYVTAAAAALVRFRETDFKKAENYLDSWGIYARLFRHASRSGIQFFPRRVS